MVSLGKENLDKLHEALASGIGRPDSSDMGAHCWENSQLKRKISLKWRMTKNFLTDPIITWALWESNEEYPVVASLRTHKAPQTDKEITAIKSLMIGWYQGASLGHTLSRIELDTQNGTIQKNLPGYPTDLSGPK